MMGMKDDHPSDSTIGPFVVRPMRLDDIEAVLALEALSTPTPWTAVGYRHELTDNPLAHYAVLGRGEMLIGYVGYWLMADEMHISMIAVHPAWRRQGWGAWLLLHALLDAWRFRPALATLEVRQHNLAAQQLYARLGFVTVGVRRRYYKDTNEDGVIMTLAPFDDACRARLLALQGKARMELRAATAA